MLLLRSLLYQIVFLSSTFLFSCAIVIAAGTNRKSPAASRLANTWGRFNLRALRIICQLDYRIQGLENLPKTNVIVLAKHQSTWETVAIRALLPSEQSWVLKQELMGVPFFGWAMRQLQPIAIDRRAGRRAVMQVIHDGQQRLDAGRWVIVFPEGTRVAPNTRRPYAIGGALLAERSGYPVLPMAHNAGYFWGRRSFIKRPGTIDLVIGQLVDSKGRKAAELNAEVEEWIETTVAGLPRA
ncbi:lysophospholipid acyltransferase family protein [Chromatium okenii]|jgi:1-acyl-sn-glycerol-3-phosphate acyltransferase|uniref:1-acyl-sn-glycerol-3-phosphate acyltransferase n=1 Tax=Chromatium okenii TaxID=61644 RepID=A0A2S7XSG7_9GAMM|nr:lysophospholipid acyltransferase family protein [Chromatium okenii]MBV5310086.1 1-acyl-sn-glycerol-3-phosphate acyltransferase [Chromatium okenii]PQJ96586.1 1-acyl-sn-glycerol-3-phosphate acyltransferase [Chromatium okenii]